MAVSEKYSKFSKKRPHRGLLGKKIGVNSRAWNMFEQNCSLTTPHGNYPVLYTDINVTSLADGVTLYEDAELTIPLVWNYNYPLYFWYYDSGFLNSISFYYEANGGNEITGWAQCYLEWQGYTDCEGSTPITVFSRFFLNGSPVSDLTVGLQLYTVYTTGNLESVYTYSAFVTNNVQFDTNNGIITGSGNCTV